MLLAVKAANAYGWQPTTITVPMSRKLGALTLLDPSGPTWPVRGRLYLYLLEVNDGCCLSGCVSMVGWPSTLMNQMQIFSSCYWVIPLETNYCHKRRSSFNSLYIFRRSNSQWSITISHNPVTSPIHEPLQSSIFFQPITASLLNCASTYAIVLLNHLVP